MSYRECKHTFHISQIMVDEVEKKSVSKSMKSKLLSFGTRENPINKCQPEQH